MSKLVEEILKNEIEVLKSKYLPEDTGHLRTAVNVLEERIKELPVSDQAYFTMHNIQIGMMEQFNKKLDTFNNEREDLWNRQWALDKSIEWCKHINELMGSPNYKVDGDGRTMTSNDVCDIANDFYKWLYKDNKA
jgi:hypothetical protein